MTPRFRKTGGRAFAKKAVSLSGKSIFGGSAHCSEMGPDHRREHPLSPGASLPETHKRGGSLKSGVRTFFFRSFQKACFPENKDGRKSVWITFEFFPLDMTTRHTSGSLSPEQGSSLWGILVFKAHIPDTRSASFSSDEGLAKAKEEDTVAWLRMF